MCIHISICVYDIYIDLYVHMTYTYIYMCTCLMHTHLYVYMSTYTHIDTREDIYTYLQEKKIYCRR